MKYYRGYAKLPSGNSLLKMYEKIHLKEKTYNLVMPCVFKVILRNFSPFQPMFIVAVSFSGIMR